MVRICTYPLILSIALSLAGCSAKVEGTSNVNTGGSSASGGEGGVGGAGGTGAQGAGGSSGASGGTGGRSGSGGIGGSTGGSGGTGGVQDAGFDAEIDAGPPMTGMLPLPDLANGGTYMGFEGGLYPNGKNTPPAAHHAAGTALARSIVPLNAAGEPAANGKIVLLSIGMSNATQAFCNSFMPSGACPAYSFVGQAQADDDVDDESLVMVDGAAGSQVTARWLGTAGDANFNRVRDERLELNGVTEAQVQVIWMKNARPMPTVGLPAQDAEAYGFEEDYGNIVRRLEQRYPNLKLVFLTSRSYGGWATTTLNPEPYAYEYGFAVKWLIESQIDQVASGDTSDTHAGDLDYRDDTAPWLAWGPYLWAAGEMPRAYDGFSYQMSDYSEDGTHPSIEGIRKIGGQLLQFFKTSPYTRCWFLAAAPECE